MNQYTLATSQHGACSKYNDRVETSLNVPSSPAESVLKSASSIRTRILGNSNRLIYYGPQNRLFCYILLKNSLEVESFLLLDFGEDFV